MSVGKKITRHFKGIIDSTLREGFQFSRANFSIEEKKKIFSYLAEIGVDYVEVGNPVKKEIREMIQELTLDKERFSVKILSHIRNHEHDLEKAQESGVDGVNILCTVDPDRLAGMNVNLNEYLGRLKKNILFARNHRLEVRVGIEDFFHQSSNMIEEVFRLAEGLRVERVGLADTLGRAMNWEVYRKVSGLRKQFTPDLEVHFHNDLGHAVSNAVTALKAGANWVDTTLLGIGERTGVTALSSFLVNLYLLSPEIAERYRLKLLTEAENYVSRICRIDTPLNLVTNPANGFAHKAGIHLNALIRFGPHKYELFSPGLVGNKRNVVAGSLISGRTREQDVRAFERRFG